MAGILDSVNQRTQLVGQNRLELLLFKLNGRQRYGINVFKVREVLQCPPLTAMPKLNSFVKGIAHIRGQTISVIDMSLATGGRPIKKLDDCFIIITEYNRTIQGFLVDSVERIVNLNWESIMPPPKGSGRYNYLTAVTEIDNELVEILDVEKILEEIAPSSTRVSEGIVSDKEIKDDLGERIILITDDSSVARNQVKRALEGLGLPIEAKKNGKEALDFLVELSESCQHSVTEKIGLLISDVEMPEMDGYTLTAEVKSRPKLADLHVILHTSLSGVFNHAMVEKVGGDGVLTRVISSLRTKLKEIGCAGVTIENKSKRGYLLSGCVVLNTAIPANSVNEVRYGFVIPLLLTGCAIFIFWLGINLLSERLNTLPAVELELQTRFQISSAFDDSNLAIHPDGKHLAVIRKSQVGSETSLEIINRLSNKQLQLSREDTISAMFWYSNNKLIFQAVSDNQCHINEVEFHEQLNQFKKRHLFECDTKNPIVSISRYKDQLAVVYRDQPSYAQLTLFELNGRPTRLVKFPALKNTPIKSIAANNSSDQLFLVTETASLNSQIHQTSKQNDWQITWQYDVTGKIFSTFLRDSQLIYTTTANRSFAITFDSDIATSINQLKHKQEVKLIAQTQNTWFSIANKTPQRALSKVSLKSGKRKELIRYKSPLRYIGRLKDQRFAFQENSAAQSKLLVWSMSSYMFTDIAHLDTNLPILKLQQTKLPKVYALQFHNELKIGRIEHKMFVESHSVASKSAAIEGESIYYLADDQTNELLIKTSIYPTTQTPLKVAFAKNFTMLVDEQSQRSDPVFSHDSKLGIYRLDADKTVLIVDTTEPVIHLLGRGETLYYQLRSGKHFLFKNGQSVALKLASNDRVVDFDTQDLYVVNAASSRSTISILK